MKQKKSEIVTIVLFCGFLASMLLCYLVLPKSNFSETEKRYLADAPALEWNSVASGDWSDDAENYMADYIPGRDFFIGLNAYFDLFTGRQVSKDIWVAEDHLIEAPVSQDDPAILRNMKTINAFSESIEQPVDLMIVPSAGWSMGLEDYADEAIIQHIYEAAGQSVRTVNITSVFDANPSLFFKTDHHWNSKGAHAAYQAYMNFLEREYSPAEDFEKAVYAQFRGSTYSRSALWLTPAEDLELWTGKKISPLPTVKAKSFTMVSSIGSAWMRQTSIPFS